MVLLLIRPGVVIDPLLGALDRQAVLVDGQRIVQVAPVDQLSTPPAAQVVDAPGQALLPGFIDSHLHLLGGSLRASFTDGQQLLQGVENCARALRAGITTAVDLGARSHGVFELREAARAGRFPAPRILAAGQGICMTGGHAHGTLAVEADGEDGVRRAARAQLKVGADIIKIMATGGANTPNERMGAPQLTPAEMRAAVEEAHKAGKPATAHATSAQGIVDALEAGVDIIQHGNGIDERGIDLLLKSGRYVVPTCSILPRMVRGDLWPVPDYMREKASAAWSERKASLARTVSAGVCMAFGTDSGGPMHPAGDIALEFEGLLEAGAQPLDLVRMATIESAKMLGVQDEIGTVAVGACADLILVDGNPLADPSALTRVRAVWQRGEPVLLTPPNDDGYQAFRVRL